MPTKRKITEPEGVYFITFTCLHWQPLIQIVDGYDLVYQWFDYLKSKGHYIVGYVIMPNHIHVLIAFRNTGQPINTIVGNGKRFMAYGIVKRLKAMSEEMLLHQLKWEVNMSDRKRNKLHEVWEDSFNWKECRINAFLRQKLNYIHANPCKGIWMLADTPANYEHCSAGYYITGKQGCYEVLHYLELADIDLTR